MKERKLDPRGEVYRLLSIFVLLGLPLYPVRGYTSRDSLPPHSIPKEILHFSKGKIFVTCLLNACVCPKMTIYFLRFRQPVLPNASWIQTKRYFLAFLSRIFTTGYSVVIFPTETYRIKALVLWNWRKSNFGSVKEIWM